MILNKIRRMERAMFRVMNMSVRWATCILMLGVVTTLLTSSLLGAPPVSDPPVGTLDAHVDGTVVSGVFGMHVECRALYTPTAGQPILKYYNGTTDASGYFNLSVDSKAGDGSYTLSPYSITISETYYKGLLKGSFQAPAQDSGKTYHISAGSLQAFDQPTGDLRIRILNASSGAPIPSAIVTIQHIDQAPTPPFPVTGIADTAGEVLYTNVRSINTSIEAKRTNFQDLSTTEPDNYILIQEATETLAEFELRENPWPFTVTPSDGSVDANVTNDIVIDFGRVMDRDTITDISQYALKKVAADTDVPFTVSASVDDQRAMIGPESSLEYNTSYSLRIDTGIRTESGGKPLWRAMVVAFTTELRPGTVAGRALGAVDNEPVDGLSIVISDQTVRTGPDGRFMFPLVPAGNYDLEVMESYLYNYTEVENIEVSKGEDVELGDIPIGEKLWGSLEVLVGSADGPLEGAFVKVFSNKLQESEMNLTTNASGKVMFQRVKAGQVNIKAGAVHHNMKVDVADVAVGETELLVIVLTEEPLPVTAELTKELTDGSADPSTDILLTVPEAVKFQSLSVALFVLDAAGNRSSEIPLAPPQSGQEPLTYVITIPGSLSMERDYEFVVDEGLLALDDRPILWRDYVFRFSTVDLPLAYLNGTALLEGKPLKGIAVSFGPFSKVTDAAGVFNLTIDPSVQETSGALFVNGSALGYMDRTMELTVQAGSVVQVGTISLLPIPGWYTITPGPGAVGVDPGTNVSFIFMHPVRTPSDGWAKHLKVLLSGTNAPITGPYTASPDNRSIVFDPDMLLEAGSSYNVEASSSLLLQDGRRALPVGNVTSFTVMPPAVRITLVEPDISGLADMDLDGKIKLSFSVAVNRTTTGNALSISPSVSGLTVVWTSSTDVRIGGLFEPLITYNMTLPAGWYGMAGEPLQEDFSLQFTTGTSYGASHEPTSLQIIPDPDLDWRPGNLVTVTGVVPNSALYEVVVTLRSGSDTLEFKATVSADGTWNITFTVPTKEGTYELILTIGVPDGPAAYERTYQGIEVAEAGGTEDGGGSIMWIVIIIVIVLIAIGAAAFLYMRSQNRRTKQELDSVEYVEEEADWDMEA